MLWTEWYQYIGMCHACTYEYTDQDLSDVDNSDDDVEFIVETEQNCC